MLQTAANQSNEEVTSKAARDTANFLRDYAAIVHGIAATSHDREFHICLIEKAHLVMNQSATLVHEAKFAMANPDDPNKASKLSAASNDVLSALGHTMDVMLLQEDVNVCITLLAKLARSILSEEYVSYGESYSELQYQLKKDVYNLIEAISNVVQSALRYLKDIVSKNTYLEPKSPVRIPSIQVQNQFLACGMGNL